MKKNIIRVMVVGVSILALGGCVVGQSLDMNYDANEASNLGGGLAVGVTVDDERPYVTSGDKPPYFIGQYRSGFGIPYDVSTDNDEPLAALVLRDLRKDLESLGFVTTTNGGERALRVTIQDWDFDSYQNGKFTYDIRVEVADAAGENLASEKVADNVYVKGTFWTGGKGGFEKAMPGMYRDAIRSVIRDNAKVIAALRP